MSKNTYSKKTIFITAIIISLSMPVYAYLDPGTGSAIISVVIALIVTGGAIFKNYWRKLLGFVNKEKTDDIDEI